MRNWNVSKRNIRIKNVYDFLVCYAELDLASRHRRTKIRIKLGETLFGGRGDTLYLAVEGAFYKI